MTSEELLSNEIYCPKTIDLSIVAYLKLGFKILLLYCSGFSIKRTSYVLLTYQYNYISDIDISKIVGSDNLCDCALIHQIQVVLAKDIPGIDHEYYFIDNKLFFPIFIGENQISDLKTYILTNYGNKN